MSVAGAKVSQETRAEDGVRGRLARRLTELGHSRVFYTHAVEERQVGLRRIRRSVILNYEHDIYFTSLYLNGS